MLFKDTYYAYQKDKICGRIRILFLWEKTMYCKKCGKDYDKKKKICKDCGIALTPGTSPATAKKGINKIAIVIIGVVMLAVIAVFLIVGLSGMVPQDLKGEWYEVSGFGGELKFMPNGVLEYTIFGEPKEGSYEYNSSIGQGNLSMEEENMSEFTCDGLTIEMDGAKFTRQVVEQMDFSEIIESLGGGSEE